MNFGLSFTNAWALLVWLPLAVYFGWLAKRTLADLSPWRNRLALGLRLVITALVVMALAGAQYVRYNRDLAVIFVIDHSDSIDAPTRAAALKFVNNAVSRRHRNDRWGAVVFGRDAYVEHLAGSGAAMDKLQSLPPGEFTNIAAAIRLGVASLPDGMQKRIVVLSDGNENLGDAMTEAQVAKANDVAVDVVPLTPPNSHEVLLENLTLPGEAKIGEPIELRTTVRSTEDSDASIKLFHDGRYLGSKSVHLVRGKNSFVFPQTVEQAGTATFEAQVETAPGNDTVAENNRSLGFVSVRGKPRVLLVTDDPEAAHFLSAALAREKVNLEVRGMGGVPLELRQMQAFDSIVLDNVPAWELSARQMLSLQSYVRDLGCGLVMIGGENSYGPGGYRATPIEETLPVTMDIRNKQYLPGGAVALIMHSLEFPDGNDWAKSICSEVTRQMGDEDYEGVIIYGMDATWAFPMWQVGPHRNQMLTRIRSINPGDMPDFDAALETAYQGLIKTPAYLKHVIILSDGDPSPPRPSLVAKLNAARITVSTIVINPHDPSGSQNMWRIAKAHRGRFYQVNNGKQIPRIFLKEAASVSRSAIIEGAFTPRQDSPSTILKGIHELPRLLGYVGTSPKSAAAGARIVLSSNQGDPVLATRQYGLGKSVAWTSDARQRWSAGWLGWSGFSKFWAQTVRWSMRPSHGADLQTSVDIDKGQGHLTIEAVDSNGNFQNFLNPVAKLVPPSLKGINLPLEQTGPGRYEAHFDTLDLGTYLINIRTEHGNKVGTQVTGGVLPYSPEYGSIGANTFLLTQLADLSGGQQLARADQVFGRSRNVGRAPRDIWMLLIGAAACLFPLDVALRRIVWGEEELQNAGQKAVQGWSKWRPGFGHQTRRGRDTSARGGGKSAKPAGRPQRDGSSRVALAPPAAAAGNTEPVNPAPHTADSAQSGEPNNNEMDRMERLRRAKRRARGEE